MRNSLILLCFSILTFSCSTFDDVFGVGSNVHSENYKINSSEGAVLDAVSIYKTEHPEYCPPVEANAKDYYSDPFHELFFYYVDKKTIVSVYVRGDKYSTTFGLQAICKEGKESARLINKDITGSEKDVVIREFEERILNPIKEILGRSK